MKMKKFFAAIITVVIAFLAMSVSASAALASPENYSLVLQPNGELWYGDEEADIFDLGGGSYTFEGGTLTLDGVNFSTSAPIALDLRAYTSPLALEIIGSNSFASTYSGMEKSVGIIAEGSITITGGGSLTAIGGTSADQNSYGIYSENGDVIISDGNVTATGGTAENWSNGISSSNIEITDSNVTATGSTAKYSNGIYVNWDIDISDSIITATGGEADTTSYGINAVRNLDISGGTVTATGNTAGIHSYNIEISEGNLSATGNSYGISVAIRFDISGGNITATGDGCGIETTYIYISDGNLTATGGEAYNSYGIFAYNDFENSGGSVTATGGKATEESYGIYAGNLIDISGGTVNATGDAAGSMSYGLFTYSDVDVSGGTVNATADTSEDSSYGIFARDSLTFSGGALTLRGKTSAANAGIAKSAVALLPEGRTKERLIYNEIDLTTVNYFEGYATFADYRKAYPDTPEEFFTATVINDTPPPSPPIALVDFNDKKVIGSIKTSKQVSSVIRFNSKRTAQTEDYVAEKFNTEVLGSFETAQQGGWGNIATITISLDKLGFEEENGTKLFVLIYDTKYKNWHEVECEIIDGNVVIKTEWSGVFAIVSEEVL